MKNETETRGITLGVWLEDKNLFQEILSNLDLEECHKADALYKKFKTDEYKKKASMQLARCFSGNNEKSKYYLNEAIRYGFHITRIDSSRFQSVWESVKTEYQVKNSLFWSKVDTTYFKEIEHLVYLDQKVRNERPVGSKDFSEEDSIDSVSTRILLDYCDKGGFPVNYDPSYFDDFRTTINPSLLAIHSDEKDKIEILQCAISTAKRGKISWNMPINICKSFYVVRVKEYDIKPLIFLNFKENGELNVEESLLQLYSIQELFSRDMPSNISIQPSKYNKTGEAIIKKNLTEIKDILIKRFGMNESQIKLSESPNLEEDKKEKDYMPPYLFTLKNSSL